MIRSRSVCSLYFIPPPATQKNWHRSEIGTSVPKGTKMDYDPTNETAYILGGRRAGWVGLYVKAGHVTPVSPLELLAEEAE